MYFCEFYVCTSNVIFIMFGTCYLLLLLLVLHEVVQLCVYVYFCIYQSDDIIYLFYHFLLFVALHACSFFKIFQLFAYGTPFIEFRLYQRLTCLQRFHCGHVYVCCWLLLVMGALVVAVLVRAYVSVFVSARARLCTQQYFENFLFVDFHFFTLGFFLLFLFDFNLPQIHIPLFISFHVFFQIFIFLQFNF